MRRGGITACVPRAADRVYERVGIVAAVVHEVGRGQALKQGQRLRGVVALVNC